MALSLRLFGGAEVLSDEQLPPGLTAGRPLMLLIFLALHPGQRLDRSHLADLLWGDEREAGPRRRSLRQALYLVRKALPEECIEADTRWVCLVKEVPSDAAELGSALTEEDPARVASLYRGPFLEGFLSGAPDGFQEWAENQRRQYARWARGLLLEAAETAVEEGSTETAAEMLEAMDRIDEFDPGIEAQKARAWMAIGRNDRAQVLARQAVDGCEELELPVPPEIRELLGRGSGPRQRGPEGRGAPPLPHAPRLVGRAKERAVLTAAWRRAAKGEGVTALVLGDPGIGKSRLIGEAAEEARSEGALILEGRSYAMESGLLYGALIEVLRQASDSPGFAGVGSVWLAELSRLLPELREKYPNLPEPESEESGARRRFYESVAQVFEALTFENPVFCVLDDLHWADDATLELLHYLGRRLCACQVLIVAGIRPGEASEQLRRLQNSLLREHGGAQIELGPLSEAETHKLVSSMFEHLPLPGDLLSLVWERSEGNPFFAVSTVEAFADRKCLEASDGEVYWDPQCARGVTGLPRRLRELIDARIDLLSDTEMLMLSIGAVSGSGFTTGLVAAAIDQEHAEVEAALSSLSKRRLIRRRRSGPVSHWEFTHDQIRETVYEGLDEQLRASLHASVARVELSGAAEVEPASVARHAAMGGDSASAFRYALEAGQWARSVFAFDGARSMFRIALANAPDAEARGLVESELAGLPEGDSREAPSARVTGRELRPWVLGAALIAVLSFGLPTILNRGAGPDPLTRPLSGVLVRTGEGGAEQLGILDDRDLRAPIQPLPEGALSAFRSQTTETLLSPTGEWMAKHLLIPGVRPDVYAIRTDGSDTLRLTTNPDDDIPVDWFPSGEAVLMRSGVGSGTAQYAYHLAVSFLDGRPVRWIEPDVWDGTWWWASDAEVSPDGTQLAVIVDRRLDGISLWTMDADGGHAKKVQELESESGQLAFSPDATHLAFSEDSGRRLTIMALDSLSSRSVEIPGTRISGEPVWSQDGMRVLISWMIDGNTEIFSVHRDSAELRRITFSPRSDAVVVRLGPQPQYVEEVEVLSPSSQGALLTQDSVPLLAVARDQRGAILEGPRVRFHCSPPVVCGLSESWIHGRTEGHATVVASAGGWRADTVAVQVLDGSALLRLEENWEGGVDPGRWRMFGEPPPLTVSGGGRNGSTGFQANGDDAWDSGVVSERTFSLHRGLTIDFWGRGVFQTPWPSWQWLTVGVTDGPLAEFVGDGPHPRIIDALSLRNEPSGRISLAWSWASIPVPETIADPSDWHRYTLQIFPHGRREVWVDGQFLSHGQQDLPLSPEVRLVVSGRATAGPVIHDDVRVYEGILFRR